MLKRLKSVSMMLFLMGASTGAAYAVASPGVTDVKITQQTGTCTGVVKDTTGETVIGASVVVKGTTNGTITGIDGDFLLSNVKQGDVIVISFVGYMTQEIVWKGQPINVTLKDDAQTLDEVVVTALGMKRATKALGYAVTEMKGDDLNTTVVNPVSALQGKVAGVEIGQSDGGLFGNNKILIRGASTLGQNNQPIYVVDGVIMDNSINTTEADWATDSNDYGNELKNLNPADFETVSVLKGAAATALYGSRGLNGAVVITTKSGKSGKGLGINVNQTFGFDILTSSPDFQNEYGPGYLSGYLTGEGYANNWNTQQFFLNGDGQRSIRELNGYYGWGPAFDGQDIVYYDGSIRPYKAYENNYRDAYQTGFNSTTNVAITGGNDKTTFYTSIGYKYAEGTTQNNTFNRLNLMAKASHKITDNITLEAGISFANSTPRNAQRNLGQYFADNTFSRAYDPSDMMNYKGTHGGLANSSYGDPNGDLPGKSLWWSVYENDYRQKETTVRPSLKLTANLTDWLTFTTEGNYNYYYTRFENKQPGSGYANEGGYYGLGNTTKEQTNFNAGFSANKTFGDFEVHGFIRGEYFHSFSQSMSMNTNGGLVAHNQYFINNSVNTISYSGKISGEKSMLGLSAQVGASWKDQLFIDLTGRNDWSSSLIYSDGHGTYSYFYPSVSGSWLISTTFRDKLPEWISFAKVRASWAQVGNDTEPYMINTAYKLNSGTNNGNNIFGADLGRTTYDNNLKPERKTSWEIGLDWRFLKNRIGVDFTYYKENTKDQIMSISVPSVSGINSQYVNAGNIQNSGIELALNTTPVSTTDFEWNLNFTYTRNRSKIISLHENVSDFIKLTGDPNYGNYRVGSVAKVGSAYGAIMTDSSPKVDEATGMNILGWHPTQKGAYLSRSGEMKEVGSINPDFLGSVSSSFRYKNWTLNIALDARFGGYVASYGSHYANAYGWSKKSLQYRDEAHGGITFTSFDGVTYHDGVIPDGIFSKGYSISLYDGSTYIVGSGANASGETYQELVDKGVLEPTHANVWTYRNNQWINADFDRGVVTDDWFVKLNYIALREVSLSYAMPQSIAGKIGARNLTLTASGRNLGYLLNTMPNGENPEAVRGTVASEFRVRNYDGVTSSFTFTINAAF